MYSQLNWFLSDVQVFAYNTAVRLEVSRFDAMLLVLVWSMCMCSQQASNNGYLLPA